MPIVYVLRSKKNGKKYVGFTEGSIEERLKQHRSGSTQWTRQNTPFDLVYQEVVADKSTALRRERFFKTGQGRRFIERVSEQIAL